MPQQSTSDWESAKVVRPATSADWDAAAPKAAPVAPKPSWGDWLKEQADHIVPSMLGLPPNMTTADVIESGKGMVKSGLATAYGARHLVEQIPGAAAVLGVAGPDVTPPKNLVTASNPAQQAGKTAFDVAQFFMGPGEIKTAQAATPLVKLLTKSYEAARQGAFSGALASAQAGGDVEAGKAPAAATTAMSMAMPAMAKAFAAAGQRVEQALVKGPTPVKTARDIARYDVGGSLAQSYDKITKKFGDYLGQLKTSLTTAGAPNINIPQVIDEATKALKAEQPYGHDVIDRAMSKVAEHITPSGSPDVDLLLGNQIKGTLGELGAWAKNAIGKTITDDTTAVEQAANKLYDVLKTKIEQASQGASVKPINQALSDLIDLKRAVVARLPIEARQNVMQLGDMIGLGTGHAWLGIANRILKSGQGAQALTKAAPNVTGNIAVPLTGAAVSKGQQ